ncbi:P-selectin-like [Fundulus heteroclitus]|uniref:P-selectin-like n=1 Tax=Fundulus heteroclitus TaxID=8078 RepID=UPI00165A354F|nr:P-selectin-like [Fundulus heteroclitus]
MSFPSEGDYWDRIAPTPVFKASTSRVNWTEGSGYMRIEACETLALRRRKARLAAGAQVKVFLVEVRPESALLPELTCLSTLQYHLHQRESHWISTNLPGSSQASTSFFTSKEDRKGQMENVFQFFAAASALCAVSSLPAHKYHFVYEPKTWNEAQSFCREHYSDLATIHNMDDVNILNEMADSQQMRAWIGLYDNWKWSGSDGEYRNWQSDQPTTYQAEENCVAMMPNSQWIDAPCEWLLRPVCSDGTGEESSFQVPA